MFVAKCWRMEPVCFCNDAKTMEYNVGFKDVLNVFQMALKMFVFSRVTACSEDFFVCFQRKTIWIYPLNLSKKREQKKIKGATKEISSMPAAL